MEKVKKYIKILLLLTLSLTLIWPAIYNGYPLVYSDSGTYIAAGFLREIPVDRPIVYSLLVRHSSLAFSLWFVIVFQSFIVAYVVYMFARRFFQKNVFLISTIIVVLLSILTGISNYSSQIMPDIFSALTIIGLAVLLSSDKLQFREYLLATIVVFSAMSHLSNMLLLFGIAFVIFLLMIFRFTSKKIFFKSIVIATTSLLMLLSINYSYSGKFQVARASNVFLLGRMIDIGVVKEYLNENCDKEKYILCKNIAELPDVGYQFIWDYSSPLYDDDCMNVKWESCWEEKNDNYGLLINDILGTPKYRNKVIKTCFFDFFKQNIDFGIGHLTPQRKTSSVEGWIDFEFNDEYSSYKNSKQYKSTQYFETMSLIQLITVIISLIAIAVILFIYREIEAIKKNRLTIFVLFTGIVGNALTVVLFSAVLDRYQSRIIWIIPLLAMMLIGVVIYQKRQKI